MRLAILFAGFIQIIRTVTTVLTSWLRAAELQPKANLIQSLSAVGRLTAGLALLWAWDVTSVPVLFAGLLGTELIVAVVTWSTWGELPQRRSAPADIMALRHRLRVLVLTFGAITLFTVLQNRLDWLMVSYFLSTKALADYSMANKWYEISVAMAGLAVVSAFPWMCRERGWLGLELAAFLRLVLVIVGFVSILGALAGPEALRVIWDAKYAGSDAAMRLLMLAVTLSVFDGILYHLLIAKGAERYTLFVLVLATVTQGVVNVTLIPAIGIQGAALGMVGLVTVTGLLYTRRASRELKRLGWPTVTYLILIPVGGWLILHTLDGLFHRVLFGLGVWFIASSGLLYKDRTTLAHILKHS